MTIHKDLIQIFIDFDLKDLKIRYSSEGNPSLFVDPLSASSPHAISDIVREALKHLDMTSTADSYLFEKADTKLRAIDQKNYEKWLRENVKVYASALAEEAILNSSLVCRRKISEGPVGAGTGAGDLFVAAVDDVATDYEPFSRYIPKRVAQDYYGKIETIKDKDRQEYFEWRTDLIIALHVSFLRGNPTPSLKLIEFFLKGDPINHFAEILESLGACRTALAYAMKDEEYRNFGDLRSRKSEDIFLSSKLHGFSKEYSQKIGDKILKNPEDCGVSCISFSYIEQPHGPKMPSISETWGIHHPIFRDLHEMFKNELKKGSSSHIYQATRYLTFEGAFGELSKEIPICTYFFNQSRPYDVYQIHMQSNLHYLLMPVLEKHFKEAIQWSGEDPNDLIQRVAKLQYLMANACLYSRGSAAICDWVEKIIYSFHGFKPEYKIDRCINLEALTCSESEFLVEYPHCIRLRKVDPD